jgi:hypothetical protein
VAVHSTGNSTDSTAKGYNRKKHIKKEKEKEDAAEYGNFKVNITE